MEIEYLKIFYPFYLVNNYHTQKKKNQTNKKQKLKLFQNIVSIFKVNSINSIFLFLFLYVGLLGFVVVAY